MLRIVLKIRKGVKMMRLIQLFECLRIERRGHYALLWLTCSDCSLARNAWHPNLQTVLLIFSITPDIKAVINPKGRAC